MKFIFTLFFLLTLVSCNEGISFPKDSKVGDASRTSTGITMKMVGFDQNILIHGDGASMSFISSEFASEYILVDEDYPIRTLPIIASRNYEEDVVKVYFSETGKSVLIAEDVWGADHFAEFGKYLFFVVERIHPVTSVRSYELYKTDGTLAGTSSVMIPNKPAELPILQGKMAYYPAGGANIDLHRVDLENLTLSVIKTNQNSTDYHVISDSKADRKMIATETSLIDLVTGAEYTMTASLMGVVDARFENNAWKIVAVNSFEREVLITIAGQNYNEVEMTGPTVPADYSFFYKFIKGGYCYFDTYEDLYCVDDSVQENFSVTGSNVEIFEILGSQYICSSSECHIRVVGLASHFIVPWRVVSPGKLHSQLIPQGGRGYIINGFDGDDFESSLEVLEFTKGANHSFLEVTSPIRAINKYFRTKNGKRLYLIRQLNIPS